MHPFPQVLALLRPMTCSIQVADNKHLPWHAGKGRVTQPLPVLRLAASPSPASPSMSPGPSPSQQSAPGGAATAGVTGLHFVGVPPAAATAARQGGAATPAATSVAAGAAAADTQHLFVVTADKIAAFGLKTGHKVWWWLGGRGWRWWWVGGGGGGLLDGAARNG